MSIRHVRENRQKVRGLKNQDFARIIMHGHRARGKHITLFYLEAESARIGIAVSKRVKKAVSRNRAKRRFREVIRHNLHLTPRAEQVWVLDPEIVVLPFNEIKNDFELVCKKVQS